MYAVIELQGHQYIVQKGDEIVVDRMEVKEKGSVEEERVLMVFDAEGKNVQVGKPHVAGAKVLMTCVSHDKGEKIRVLKFRRKNRYEKVKGFRPHQTILKIKDVVCNGG